jgi:putative membrane protein
MMNWTGNGMNGWGYAFMTISMLLFWALVITAIVLLVGRMGGPQTPNTQSKQPKPTTPEEILAERFARGEIDDEEYHRRRAILREPGRP